MADKHERPLRPVAPAPVHSAEEEIGEYRSKDLEFDWPFEEEYEPRYPLTERERELVELNRSEKDASVTWLKARTRHVVDKELGNGTESGTT